MERDLRRCWGPPAALIEDAPLRFGLGLPKEFAPRQHTLSNCLQGDFCVERGCVLRIRG